MLRGLFGCLLGILAHGRGPRSLRPPSKGVQGTNLRRTGKGQGADGGVTEIASICYLQSEAGMLRSLAGAWPARVDDSIVCGTPRRRTNAKSADAAGAKIPFLSGLPPQEGSLLKPRTLRALAGAKAFSSPSPSSSRKTLRRRTNSKSADAATAAAAKIPSSWVPQTKGVPLKSPSAADAKGR